MLIELNRPTNRPASISWRREVSFFPARLPAGRRPVLRAAGAQLLRALMIIRAKLKVFYRISLASSSAFGVLLILRSAERRQRRAQSSRPTDRPGGQQVSQPALLMIINAKLEVFHRVSIASRLLGLPVGLSRFVLGSGDADGVWRA